MAEVAEQATAAPPRIGKQGDPCVMVIFGAAGDLDGTHADSRALQPGARGIAFPRICRGRSGTHKCHSNDEFRKKVHEDVKRIATNAWTTICGNGSRAASITLPAISATTSCTRNSRIFSKD
jgi:hypothetical protein